MNEGLGLVPLVPPKQTTPAPRGRRALPPIAKSMPVHFPLETPNAVDVAQGRGAISFGDQEGTIRAGTPECAPGIHVLHLCIEVLHVLLEPHALPRSRHHARVQAVGLPSAIPPLAEHLSVLRARHFLCVAHHTGSSVGCAAGGTVDSSPPSLNEGSAASRHSRFFPRR